MDIIELTSLQREMLRQLTAKNGQFVNALKANGWSETTTLGSTKTKRILVHPYSGECIDATPPTPSMIKELYPSNKVSMYEYQPPRTVSI